MSSTDCAANIVTVSFVYIGRGNRPRLLRLIDPIQKDGSAQFVALMLGVVTSTTARSF